MTLRVVEPRIMLHFYVRNMLLMTVAGIVCTCIPLSETKWRKWTTVVVYMCRCEFRRIEKVQAMS